jgi:hypothetical protein
MPSSQQQAAPASPEEGGPSLAMDQEPGEAAPGGESNKRLTLRLVLLIVVGLLLLCVLCGVVGNYVVPMLTQGITVQP